MAIKIESNIDLKPYNTFKVKSIARYLVNINNEQDLKELLTHEVYKSNKRIILGGGSNILLMNDFDGLVIKSEEKEIKILEETDDAILIKASSGVVWHELVLYCLKHNWGGLENLSLIPGTVGAAPIQNIGAYGTEIKELIQHVEGIDLINGNHLTISNNNCRFSYRDSVFKHELKEKIFISSVTLRLTKKNHHVNFQYDALKKYFEQHVNNDPSIQDISNAVITIRKSKLPDPLVIGNAGSFFKNPVVDQQQLNALQNQWPTIPSYHFENQLFKVPAGWLIEQCNWKGKKIGDAGVHQHQALVIVNYNNASGQEIFSLSQKIIHDVKEKFNITLTPEVNMIS